MLDRKFFYNLQDIFGKGTFVTSDIVNNPEVKEILKSENFDLIIFETFMTEALYGLGEYFNCPTVGLSSFGANTPLDLLVGNNSPISYIPTLFLQHSFEITFWHRCLNVALSLVDKMTYDYLYLPHQRKLYEELFPNATLTFDQANRNFSLVLLNQHFSLNFPRPYVPNMIEVAGLHIEETPDKLPLHIQEFLYNAPQGVIYFHLAVSIKSFKLDSNNTLIFLNTFKDLNYHIIWNMDYMPPLGQKYKNILHVNNISHYSLLKHPNVKLFIANGELLSLMDAVYYAKPILGIPMFPHHHFTINMAIKMGYCLGIKLKNLSVSKLKQNILELIQNPRYLQNIKELSEIFRDQPLKPKEKAVYWIEYVLRHKGAKHLRSEGRFLNFWQFYNIDVFAAYLGAFIVIVLISYLIMKIVHNLLYKSRNKLEIKVKRK